MGGGRGYSGDEDRVDEDLDSVASFIKDDDVSVSEPEYATAAWSTAAPAFCRLMRAASVMMLLPELRPRL
jgi:hypothetical protein